MLKIQLVVGARIWVQDAQLQESELLVTGLGPKSPSRAKARLVFELARLSLVLGLSSPSHCVASPGFSLCLLGLFASLLPVRTRTGRPWPPALIEGSRQSRHLSSGLADSQAARDHEATFPGPVKEGGESICSFCLPSWERSVCQVGNGMHLIAGGRLRGLTLFK